MSNASPAQTDGPTSPSGPTPPAAMPARPPKPAGRPTGTAEQRGGRRRPAATRSTAEWVTLAISGLIVGALVALTSYVYLTGSDAPASIEVEPHPAETFQNGARYALPVTVRNRGGATGEDVTVRVTLTGRDGRQETAEWRVQFLSGGGASHGVAVFGSDPRQGRVEAGVVSYLEP